MSAKSVVKPKLKRLLCIQNITRLLLGGVQRTNSIGLRSSIVRMLMSRGVIATSKIDILSSEARFWCPHARCGARVVSHRRAGPAMGWAPWPLQLPLLRGPRCLLHVDGQCICWDACVLGPRDATYDSGQKVWMGNGMGGGLQLSNNVSMCCGPMTGLVRTPKCNNVS